MRLLAWGGQANWPFEKLEPHAYDVIMADAPWDFSLYSEKGGNKSAQKHYRCLPLEEIMAFPVLDLAAENCLLLMWATNPMLEEQLRCLRAWGFKYKTMTTWRKITKYGKVGFGTGYIVRSSTEPILIGARGHPQNLSKSSRSIFDGMLREHSRKPDEAFAWAERLTPKARRRVELFSRTNRPGWESWGDQVGLFNQEGGGDGRQGAPGQPQADDAFRGEAGDLLSRM